LVFPFFFSVFCNYFELNPADTNVFLVQTSVKLMYTVESSMK
jgi:hypothetical protein